jgi:hypothetical protein
MMEGQRKITRCKFHPKAFCGPKMGRDNEVKKEVKFMKEYYT